MNANSIDDVELWLLRTPRTADRKHIAGWAQLLDSDERRRCQQLRIDTARDRFELGHGLVRTALSQRLPIAPQDWKFRRSDKGHPEICGPANAALPAFSLSYTDGLIACAVSASGPIGIDVEGVANDYPYADVARRVLSEAEHAALTALPSAGRRERFFELWTLKEAYLKALGIGLEPDLCTLDFNLDTPGELTASLNDNGPWQFELFAPVPQQRLALADGRGAPLRVSAYWATAPGAPGRQFSCTRLARTRELN